MRVQGGAASQGFIWQGIFFALTSLQCVACRFTLQELLDSNIACMRIAGENDVFVTAGGMLDILQGCLIYRGRSLEAIRNYLDILSTDECTGDHSELPTGSQELPAASSTLQSIVEPGGCSQQSSTLQRQEPDNHCPVSELITLAETVTTDEDISIEDKFYNTQKGTQEVSKALADIIRFLFPLENGELNIHSSRAPSLEEYLNRYSQSQRPWVLTELLISPNPAIKISPEIRLLIEFIRTPVPPAYKICSMSSGLYFLTREALISTFLYLYIDNLQEYRDLLYSLKNMPGEGPSRLFTDKYAIGTEALRSVTEMMAHPPLLPACMHIMLRTLHGARVYPVDAHLMDDLKKATFEYALLRLFNCLAFSPEYDCYDSRRLPETAAQLRQYYEVEASSRQVSMSSWEAWRKLIFEKCYLNPVGRASLTAMGDLIDFVSAVGDLLGIPVEELRKIDPWQRYNEQRYTKALNDVRDVLGSLMCEVCAYSSTVGKPLACDISTFHYENREIKLQVKFLHEDGDSTDIVLSFEGDARNLWVAARSAHPHFTPAYVREPTCPRRELLATNTLDRLVAHTSNNVCMRPRQAPFMFSTPLEFVTRYLQEEVPQMQCLADLRVLVPLKTDPRNLHAKTFDRIFKRAFNHYMVDYVVYTDINVAALITNKKCLEYCASYLSPRACDFWTEVYDLKPPIAPRRVIDYIRLVNAQEKDPGSHSLAGCSRMDTSRRDGASCSALANGADTSEDEITEGAVAKPSHSKDVTVECDEERTDRINDNASFDDKDTANIELFIESLSTNPQAPYIFTMLEWMNVPCLLTEIKRANEGSIASANRLYGKQIHFTVENFVLLTKSIPNELKQRGALRQKLLVVIVALLPFDVVTAEIISHDITSLKDLFVLIEQLILLNNTISIDTRMPIAVVDRLLAFLAESKLYHPRAIDPWLLRILYLSITASDNTEKAMLEQLHAMLQNCDPEKKYEADPAIDINALFTFKKPSSHSAETSAHASEDNKSSMTSTEINFYIKTHAYETCIVRCANIKKWVN